MKNHALALAVVSAWGAAPQAYSHELAYSKSEQIHVLVEGEARDLVQTRIWPSPCNARPGMIRSR